MNTLKQLITRYENVQSEIDDLKEDQKAILQEVKLATYDPKIFKKVIAIRKKSRAEHEQLEEAVQIMLDDLGE